MNILNKLISKFSSSLVFGYPIWQVFVVLIGGAGAGFSYKFHQITYIYPEAWLSYPLNLILPNMIIGGILFLVLWIGYCSLLAWISSKPIQTLQKFDALSFLTFFFMFGIYYLPGYVTPIIVKLFIAWKLLFFLFNIPFRKKMFPQIKAYKLTLIDMIGLSIFSAFIWMNTSYLTLGRGVNAHLSVKAALLAKYFQYPAWNPEMYCGGWTFIYGQVYGYLWYWLIGFLPISPSLFAQFVAFETFLPMYFLLISSCIFFYLFLRKSLLLSRTVSIFGGLVYLLNFYMQGIILDEANCALAYLIFPCVFLTTEQGLKKRNLLFAAVSGLLINFLMPSTYAHPESFYIYYFIIGVFYLSASLFYYEKKSLFPIISLVIFGLSHFCFANYYFPIFEFTHVYNEAVNLGEEGDRLTRGFGYYVPLFYPFYVGIIPAFLIVYGFFNYRKIIGKEFITPRFLGVFFFSLFIFLSLAQLGRDLPIYSILKLPDKYMFPFVHYWMRFAPGLFFFHYVIACFGLEILFREIDDLSQRIKYPDKLSTTISKLTFYSIFFLRKNIWVLASVIVLAAIIVTGKIFYLGESPNKNLFVIPHIGSARDFEFFWSYLIIGAFAIFVIMFVNKKSARIITFFAIAIIPLIHYMEPTLNLLELPNYNRKLTHIKDIFFKKMEQFPAPYFNMESNQFFLPYIERNPRDTNALNAFNNYLSKQTLPDKANKWLAEDLTLRIDKGFEPKINYIREKILPLQDTFLKSYLSDREFNRFMEIGKATQSFSFTYHMYPLANRLFNIGGNVGRPHHWRWFPQFDHFFPWKVCDDCAWYMEPGDLVERLWVLNLLGVKHLVVSEEDYITCKEFDEILNKKVSLENLIKNSLFKNWNNEIPFPEGWKTVGSGGSVNKISDSVVELFSGPVAKKNIEWELVQDVMSLTKDTSMRGKSYVLGVWVKASAPDCVRVLIRDFYSDKRSICHTGSGEWEFLTVTKCVHPDAPLVEAICMIEEKNTSAQFYKPILIEGGTLHEYYLTRKEIQDSFIEKETLKTEKYKTFIDFPVEGKSFDYNHKILQLRNDSVLPMMFLVNKFTLVNPELGKGEQWNAMKSIDYRNEILLEKEPFLPMSELEQSILSKNNLSDSDAVKIIDVRGNIAAAKVNVKGLHSYLFYSDNYHPDWLALVDGKPTTVYRADLAFKAIVVPRGDHLVWFEFRPVSLWIGLYVSSITLLIIVFAGSKKIMYYCDANEHVGV